MVRAPGRTSSDKIVRMVECRIVPPASKAVICTDMDNTLVLGQKFHPSTLEAIAELKQRDIQIIPVTGRGPELARGVLEDVSLPLYPGGYHHGAITYDADGTVLINKTMSPDLVKIISDTVENIKEDPVRSANYEDIVIMVQGLNDRLLLNDAKGLGKGILFKLGSAASNIKTQSSLEEMDLENFPTYQSSLCCFIKEGLDIHEHLIYIRDRIFKATRDLGHDNLQILISGDNFIDVVRTDVDKKFAIEAMAKNLGFELKNVIALGDAQNDINFMKAAGYSICMFDGLTDAKEVADVTSPKSTLEGGWAMALKDAGIL